VSRTPAGPLALVAYAAALLVLAFPLRAALAGKSEVADGMPCMDIHRYDLANASHRLGCGDQNAALDESDEIAALEAIRIALSEVGDGSIYVWHRRYGPLGGLVQPSASYKDPAGRVCRHILLIITNRERVGRAQGIACRLGNGRWQLDG